MSATAGSEAGADFAPLQPGSPGLEAWRGLIYANSRLMGELDEELRREHNFTLGEFDVLATLSRAPGNRRRMCDLAAAVVLSASGLSRRVDRLEKGGLVRRERSAEDGRSIEATLTPEGERVFERVSDFHRAGVNRLFAAAYSESELETLAELLARLDDGGRD